MSIKLKEFKKSDLKDLYKITSNSSVMKFVQNGKSWNENKTIRFINNSIEEQKNKKKLIIFLKLF